MVLVVFAGDLHVMMLAGPAIDFGPTVKFGFANNIAPSFLSAIYFQWRGQDLSCD